MKELVHVEGRRVSYSQGVSHLAAALSPLGLAANVVAQLAACVTELRQLEIESQKIATARQITLELIEVRRREVEFALQALRLDAASQSGTLNGLHDALGIASRMMASRLISDDERRMAQGTVEILTKGLVGLHKANGHKLVSIVDSVLNGQGAMMYNYLPPAT
ncbi:hypothetical protein [Kribbella sp. NPDC004536]|uniref:hypothetical protein n=1 Tax=Kribbella sp. NPDC004536 TaxID=3364106 RepID=UPI0036A4E04C